MAPLCVDLDGTLIRSDLLLETLILLLKRNPLYLLLTPLWLVHGKATLKAEISARVTLNPEALPYDRGLIRWLEAERGAGRQLWLCTAANELLASRVASHLGIFEGVLASDRSVNLAAEVKAARLVQCFGERGFDYCGNSHHDIEVWKRARGAIVVNGSRRLERNTARHAPIMRTFSAHTSMLHDVAGVLRPHQWAKHVLVLVPLLTAHWVGDVHSVIAALLALTAFCLCTSSVCIVNDMVDLEADRAHAQRSKRPFAAGDLSLLVGFALAPALLIAAVLIAAFLPLNFQLALGAYYFLAVIYSFALKRLAIIGAAALAGLYTLQIIAGAAAVGMPLSFWFLLFSIALFLSLAFVKRYTELDGLRRQ